MSTRAALAFDPCCDDAAGPDPLSGYLEMLALIERLHRLLLDVIKDEFEQAGQIELNPVQALLLFNIGPKTVTAGELRSRGYYQGSNVSYNLKKLVEAGFIDHQRCEVDRRSVRLRLTPRGLAVHRLVAELFSRHAAQLHAQARLGAGGVESVTRDLRSVERYWAEEIRCLY